MGRKEILDILLAAREQTTVLFSTHILSDAERICTDIAFLECGKAAVQGKISELKKLRRREEFTLELSAEANMRELLAKFPFAREAGKETLAFSGGEEELFPLLSFMAERKIPFSKIERAEPTLESIFMEVTGK